MVNIDTEKDIERLRQVARLLAVENQRLHERLQQLVSQLAEARGEERGQLELELTRLREQIERQNRALYGRSSERQAQSPEDKKADELPKPRRGHGPKAQPALPIVEVVELLDAPDCTCPQCGGQLAPMEGQFEQADEVDVVERSFRIVRRKRQKYTCRCGACVETAPAPPRVVPGGRYSNAVAVAIAIAKYADHIPLARQVTQMRRLGLAVSSQVLWDQLWALYGVLAPSYQAVQDYVLSHLVIGADETTWPLMEKDKTITCWAWAVCCPDAVFYLIQHARSEEAAAAILRDFSGTVVADGYSAYTALRKTRAKDYEQGRLALTADAGAVPPPFRIANCWAHARRRFVDCQANAPQVSQILDLMRELYAVESEPRHGPEPERLAALARDRKQRSEPLVDQIFAWARSQVARPSSALAGAIT
jgi:transposase